jgi:hypothetical protein
MCIRKLDLIYIDFTEVRNAVLFSTATTTKNLYFSFWFKVRVKPTSHIY